MKKHLRQEYGWKEIKKRKVYKRPKNCEVICQECGKTFMVESNRKNQAKFCCRECSSRNIGKRKQKYVIKTKICPVCGDIFDFRSRPYRKDRVYCSASCRAIGIWQNRKGASKDENM